MKKRSLLALLLILLPNLSHAGLSDVGFTDVSNLTAEASEALIREVAFGLDFHDYETAAPLGLLVGIDVGVSLTSLTLSEDFVAAGALIGMDVSQVPDPLPLPRINVHKGLPLGIDVGFGFILLGDVFLMGGSVKWSFMPGAWDIAARASYNYTKLNFIRTRTYNVDFLVSRRLGFWFEPYLGIGYQIGSGDMAIPVSQVADTTVTGGATFSTFKYFAGIKLHLSLLKITGEYSNNLTNQMSMGMKVSVGL